MDPQPAAPVKQIKEQDDILYCVVFSKIILKLIEKGYINNFDKFDDKDYLEKICNIFEAKNNDYSIELYHLKYTCCWNLKKKFYRILEDNYNTVNDNDIINMSIDISTKTPEFSNILNMSEVANELKNILQINRDTYETKIQEFEVSILQKLYKFNTLNLYKNIELFQEYVHNKWLETNEFNLVEYLEKFNDFFYITHEKTIIIQLSKIVQELNKIINTN